MLCCAVLCWGGAVLCWAVLSWGGAVLCCAVLWLWAVLCCAVLCCAVSCAVLGCIELGWSCAVLGCIELGWGCSVMHRRGLWLTVTPYPFPRIISGAMKWGVPHRVHVRSDESTLSQRQAVSSEW